MHITLEADYALRIVDTLARQDKRIEAKAIAEKSCVTLRFSLKILRKLVAEGIVRSYKGSQGGYELAKPPGEITLFEVLSTIEGPLAVNRCVRDDHNCTRRIKGKCPYHHLFRHVSEQMAAQFSAVTFADMLPEIRVK